MQTNTSTMITQKLKIGPISKAYRPARPNEGDGSHRDTLAYLVLAPEAVNCGWLQASLLAIGGSPSSLQEGHCFLGITTC
jgi:hypothetical protein